MKLKFNLIIKDDDKNKKPQFSNKLVDKFSYDGSDYLRISPKPFVTIDISKSGDKNDDWNPNTQCNINKMSLFRLVKECKYMLDCFKIRDLFYIKDKHLCVNTDIANSNCRILRLPTNKIIKMIHCVVHDSDNAEMEYEGICFMINSVDNFCLLTYEELEYLYYELSHIDMYVLSMNIINTYLLIHNNHMESRQLKLEKMIVEIKNDIINSRQLPKIEKPHGIEDEIKEV